MLFACTAFLNFEVEAATPSISPTIQSTEAVGDTIPQQKIRLWIPVQLTLRQNLIRAAKTNSQKAKSRKLRICIPEDGLFK